MRRFGRRSSQVGVGIWDQGKRRWIIGIAAIVVAGSIAAVAAIHLVAAPATSPWWAGPPGIPPSACAWPAVYRTAAQAHEGLGACDGIFVDPPPEVRLHVGEELDLHMTTGAPPGSAAPPSLYPLPASPDVRVLRLVSVSDAGATGAYRAIAPGVVTLSTNGWCWHSATDSETDGTCPVVRVTVIA